MRLLNVDSLELVKFSDDERPKYVIASHRWANGFEATIKDIRKRRNTSSVGYKKVEAFATYIRENVPLLKWLWIDTCCIDQDSAAELSEAVNLMFDWYRDAEICLAYLADVDTIEDQSVFKQSEWFLRGWTLQELLAPRTVVFLTRAWQVIGNKGGPANHYSGTAIGPGLDREVSMITGIPEQVLHNYRTSLGFSVEERLRWMERRRTMREEDLSYALYGIFGVTAGANYGEKRTAARARLLRAIAEKDNPGQLTQHHTTKVELESRGAMFPTTMRYIKRFLVDRFDSGWDLIDEFEASKADSSTTFAGGTFSAEYPGDRTTKLFLTIPSSKGDCRADWTVIAPSATYYPGKHAGHLIFLRDFPFKEPAVYWDTPFLSPFPRHGRLSGNIRESWSPASRSLLHVVESMASLILLSPKDASKQHPPGGFGLHTLPKPVPGGSLFEFPCVDEDWLRQCTQFFCRAYNRVDDVFDGLDGSTREDDPDRVESITEHHRTVSCQAINGFIDHVLIKFCKLTGPFAVDELSAEEYFSKVITTGDWIEGEKRWAHMLDERSFWMVSQDRDGGDRNRFYYM